MNLEELEVQLSNPIEENGKKIGDTMYATNINMIGNAISMLKIEDSDKILEIGYGNGKHLSLVFDAYASLSYKGLEISQMMHDQTNQNFSAMKINAEIGFYLYDGTNILFKNQLFQKVFTVNTIYFWKDANYLLREIYRVLTDKGVCTISFSTERFMKKLPFVKNRFQLYSEESATELIERNGFLIEKVKTIVDKVKSKSGDIVNREFITLRLVKDNLR